LTDKFVETDFLAKQLNLHPVAFRRLLRVLDAFDVVELDGTKVKSTGQTQFLAQIRSPHLYDAFRCFDNLEYSIKHNEACWSTAFGKPFYPYLADHQQKLKEFVNWCSDSAKSWLHGVLSMYDFSQFDTLVDVGGGEGYFLATILEKHSEIHGILFDRPDVTESAKTFVDSTTYLNRIKIVSGDFFESVPAGGDGYTVCRTLLNWNDDEAISILNNCHTAMTDHSKLLIIDFMMPHKSHRNYKRTVQSDLNLLGTINSCNRTINEWKSLVEQSKLQLINVIIGDENIEPEPISPIIVLECVK